MVSHAAEGREEEPKRTSISTQASVGLPYLSGAAKNSVLYANCGRDLQSEPLRLRSISITGFVNIRAVHFPAREARVFLDQAT